MNTEPFEALRAAYSANGGEFPYIPAGLLGAGGMGAVYRVVHTPTGHEAAMKLLRHPGGSTDLRNFFRREIAIMAELEHPNVVRLEASGDLDDLVWVAMELCPGGSVADRGRASRPPFTSGEAVAVICDAAAGLAYLHSRGYVHRDVKPQNILLAADGMAKIADLGMAKNSAFAGRSGYTHTGEWGGTVDFMAREQLVNFKYVEPTADVFSIGGTLYWMLTGSFPRGTGAGVNAPVVPLLQQSPGLPPKLAQVVDRALARSPGERFPTATEFRDALSELAAAADCVETTSS